CCSTPSETGILRFDGTGRHVLVRNNQFTTGLVNNDTLHIGYAGDADVAPMQLSFDGSKLLFGVTGVLIDTATAPPLQLALQSLAPFTLITGGIYLAPMNSSVNPSLYTAPAPRPGRHVLTLALTPRRGGPALSFTAQVLDPPFLVVSGGSNAVVSAR